MVVALPVDSPVPNTRAESRTRGSATKFGISWRRYRLIAVPELIAAAGILIGLFWRPRECWPQPG